MNKFQEELAEILKVDSGQMAADLTLEDASWDSLAVVSTIALIDEHYDEEVSATALVSCETVGDIEQLISTLKTGNEPNAA